MNHQGTYMALNVNVPAIYNDAREDLRKLFSFYVKEL